MYDNRQDQSLIHQHLHEETTEWFPAPFNVPISAPKAITNWRDDRARYQLLQTRWPRTRAVRQLQDLSTIALQFTKKEVRQKQSFSASSGTENTAPSLFQLDMEGVLPLAPQLRV